MDWKRLLGALLTLALVTGFATTDWEARRFEREIGGMVGPAGPDHGGPVADGTYRDWLSSGPRVDAKERLGNQGMTIKSKRNKVVATVVKTAAYERLGRN